MTTAQLQAGQPITFPDGTMQYHYRDYLALLITDAPADGTQYTRKDSAWTAVSGLTARLFDGGDSGSSTVFRAIDGGASNNTLPYSWFNSFDGGLSG